MTESHEKPWFQQGSVVLSIAAIALATWSLLSHREEIHRAQRDEFRKLITELQSSTTTTPSSGDRSAAARSWVYFDAARRLEPELRSEDVPVVDYLVMANFAFAHCDLQLGGEYLKKAERQLDRRSSLTGKSLGLMAIGHLHFAHSPKTDLAAGRGFYEKALASAGHLESHQRAFVVAGIHRERAIDEYAAKQEKEGDEESQQARKTLESVSLPSTYLDDWQADFDSAILQAKVRGGLL